MKRGGLEPWTGCRDDPDEVQWGFEGRSILENCWFSLLLGGLVALLGLGETS
jgi:hypothetical protein